MCVVYAQTAFEIWVIGININHYTRLRYVRTDVEFISDFRYAVARVFRVFTVHLLSHTLHSTHRFNSISNGKIAFNKWKFHFDRNRATAININYVVGARLNGNLCKFRCVCVMCIICFGCRRPSTIWLAAVAATCPTQICQRCWFLTDQFFLLALFIGAMELGLHFGINEITVSFCT